MTTARTHVRSVGRGGTPRPKAATVKPDDYTPVDADSFAAVEVPSVSGTLTTESVDPSTIEFDPADHNIEDVQKYVEGNPTHVDAILELELEGKNRSTLVEWLDDFGDDEEGDD